MIMSLRYWWLTKPILYIFWTNNINTHNPLICQPKIISNQKWKSYIYIFGIIVLMLYLVESTIFNKVPQSFATNDEWWNIWLHQSNVICVIYALVIPTKEHLLKYKVLPMCTLVYIKYKLNRMWPKSCD